MNYWPRWVGDWKKKTAHLTLAEKGAYGELLDHSYITETPLPLEKEALYRICGAVGPKECAAVDKVLAEFFLRNDHGYSHVRVSEEISKRSAYIDTQRELAERRWAKERAKNSATSQRVNGASFAPPEWIDRDKWDAWVKIRPAKARTPAALSAAIEKLERFRANGHDANAIVAESLANGWQGLFQPDKNKQRGSLAEQNAASVDEFVRRVKEGQ